jgi:SAM-dependent methyltransferase
LISIVTEQTHHHHHHHHDDDDGHHHPGENGESGMAELLDLDAEVVQSFLTELTDWLAELAGEPDPARILDLGSGTGAGTFALLARFARAEVIALDTSEQMLRRLEEKARVLGVSDRVTTVQADLDAVWPPLGTVDLVWASSSLHHVKHPDQVLAEVFATIRRRGLLGVIEMDSFPSFLSDDIGLGCPGLEARCHALLAETRAAEVPHLGSDWSAMLSNAGFTVEAERHFAIDLTPPLPDSAKLYARATLRRIRAALDGRLSPEDLATLDTLIESDGPDSLLKREDLTVRARRKVWVARRP